MQPDHTRRRHWTRFSLWAVAGFTTSFAIVTGFSIGIFIAPLAAASIFLAVDHSGTPSPSGVLLGVGLTSTIIGLINVDELSCPESGQRVLDGGRVIEGCGSFDPLPWLVVGGVLVLVSMISPIVRPTG